MKIALFGASGRLGHSIADLIAQNKNFILSEAIAHSESVSLGTNLNGIPICASFQGTADLLIDVSLNKAFPNPLLVAVKARLPIVIGISGLDELQMDLIRRSAKQIPIFYSINFSVGMAIFRRLAREAARSFYPSSTADIFEAHHAQKKDSPSGSALSIAKELQKSGKTAQIHSIRSGKIIGEHSLLLNCDEERLEIAHTVHSREAFARGALSAATFLINQKPGLYGMDDLL